MNNQSSGTGFGDTDWRAHRDAEPLLWEHLYRRLKDIARAQMRGESRPDLMQPTALVNEAWLRMADLRMEWRDREHFLAMAARVMRRVLVDQARARDAEMRDARLRVTLTTGLADEPVTGDVLDLHRALEDLAALDARKAEVIELTYFGGMTYEQVGHVLSLSEATVKRELRTARAWLVSQMASAGDPGEP